MSECLALFNFKIDNVMHLYLCLYNNTENILGHFILIFYSNMLLINTKLFHFNTEINRHSINKTWLFFFIFAISLKHKILFFTQKLTYISNI